MTEGKTGQPLNFVLVFLLGIIGIAIIQSSLNTAIDASGRLPLPVARIA